jgi:hypothetical protein
LVKLWKERLTASNIRTEYKNLWRRKENAAGNGEKEKF